MDFLLLCEGRDYTRAGEPSDRREYEGLCMRKVEAISRVQRHGAGNGQCLRWSAPDTLKCHTRTG